MRKYFISRGIQLLIVMLLASFITFLLTYISPSDPAEMMLTAHDVIPTEELLEKTREEMGLNDPFIVQYGNWLIGVLRGNLGYSSSEREQVAVVLGSRMLMTIRLAVAAIVMLIVFSLSLGVLSAVKNNTFIDQVIKGISFAGISMPSFWLGLILIYYFVVKQRWFTITNPYALESVILPALTLAIPLSGRYIRQIRAAVLEQYTEDYVVGARARGIHEMRIMKKHILPNALKSIITLLGLSIAVLLGGTVIVENIFSWPGLGSMALNAVTYRDYSLLQGYVLFMAFIYVSINFLVDMTTQLLDPRVRLGGYQDDV